MRRSMLLATSAALVLVLAGCGDDQGTGASATTAPSAAGTSVKLSDSDLGEILTTDDGTTLYLFTPDTGTESTCTGGCASAWPPLTGPATGDGVDADDLGTTTRDDGTEQVTFYGHPVYTYAGDAGPGETSGQGSGGKWYVIDEDGNAVMTSAGASTPTTAATKGGY